MSEMRVYCVPMTLTQADGRGFIASNERVRTVAAGDTEDHAAQHFASALQGLVDAFGIGELGAYDCGMADVGSERWSTMLQTVPCSTEHGDMATVARCWHLQFNPNHIVTVGPIPVFRCSVCENETALLDVLVELERGLEPLVRRIPAGSYVALLRNAE